MKKAYVKEGKTELWVAKIDAATLGIYTAPNTDGHPAYTIGLSGTYVGMKTSNILRQPDVRAAVLSGRSTTIYQIKPKTPETPRRPGTDARPDPLTRIRWF